MLQASTQKVIRRINHASSLTTAPLRVAAYCRVSSDSTDQLHSYAAQIKYYTEYIGRHPDWELADIYADEGLTGTKTAGREDLNRLISDCKRGKIDRVLVKAISRFARNTYDSLALARMLKGCGVSVYFEEQDIDTGTMNDEFIYTMQSMAAQGESIAISQNMRWHYRDVMESGDFVGTIPAYGYKIVNRTLEAYEPETAIVRRIFTLYLSGIGKQAIANILNCEGIPRRYNSKKWYVDTISYILNNERYIGDALLQKSYTTENFPFQKKRNNGEMPQYYVENSHPAIISRKTFEAARRLCAEKDKKRTSSVRYPLSGKIDCSDCGHPFRRMMINDIAYWQCSYHASGRQKCSGFRYPDESICDAFLLLINKLIFNREHILSSLITDLERMQNRSGMAANKVYEIDRQIAAMTTKIHALTQHRASGLMDAADFTAQTSVVNTQISALRTERRKLLAEDENDEIIDELRDLDSILADSTLQTEFNDELFGQIVLKITALSTDSLCFKLQGGLELTETISYRKRR